MVQSGARIETPLSTADPGPCRSLRERTGCGRAESANAARRTGAGAHAIPWRDAPLVLVGNSLGAWMAMLYTQKCPQRVTRVILIDGGPIKGVSEIGIMPKDREEARRALDAALDPSTPRRPNFVLRSEEDTSE